MQAKSRFVRRGHSVAALLLKLNDWSISYPVQKATPLQLQCQVRQRRLLSFRRVGLLQVFGRYGVGE